MYPFDYVRADSAAHASALLREHPEARLLAGGQSLLPTMRMRLAAPSMLIDLGRAAGLSGVTEVTGVAEVTGAAGAAREPAHTAPGQSRAPARVIRIGAMTTHTQVADSPLVRGTIPALAALAAGIGDRQVRNRGTIGGSVANNDPAACYPGAVLALNATIETDRRRIAADDFFRGLFTTALEPDEVLVALHVPVPRRAAYLKFEQPASRFALVGVAVAVTAGGVRVAVTGAGPGVFRAEALEDRLQARFEPAALEGARIDAAGLGGDLHAGADYRAHLIVVLAQRAVARALGTADPASPSSRPPAAVDPRGSR